MLTTAQAAQLVGVARITIVKWIVRGHLSATKFGRDWMIDPHDLAAFQQQPPRKAGRPPKASH